MCWGQSCPALRFCATTLRNKLENRDRLAVLYTTYMLSHQHRFYATGRLLAKKEGDDAKDLKLAHLVLPGIA